MFSDSQQVPGIVMKSKGSLSRSQELVTCPHPVTDKSSPTSPPYSFKTYFNIIFPPNSMFSKDFFPVR